MLRILMTEGASSSARQTLYCIPRPAKVDVCVSSLMSQCRFSSLIDRRLTCPHISRSPREYLDFIRKQIRTGRYDTVLPTNEEVYLLSRFRDELSGQVGIALPPFSSVRRLQGKQAFFHLMSELGLPTPQTRFATADDAIAESPPTPFFLKTEFGTGSLSVRMIADRQALGPAIDELKSNGRFRPEEPLVMQEVATGIHSTVQAVFQDGRLIAIHMTEAQEVGFLGTPMLRISVRHPHVEDHMRKLGEALNWHGAIFLEYFFDPTTGRVSYIEANPRIGEIANAWLSGVNFADLMLRIGLGEHCEEVSRSRVGVRSHVGFIWLISAAANGGNRREILRLRRRMRGLSKEDPPVENETTRPAEDRLSILPAIKTFLHLMVSPQSAAGHVRGAVNAYAVSGDAIYQIDHEAGHWST